MLPNEFWVQYAEYYNNDQNRTHTRCRRFNALIPHVTLIFHPYLLYFTRRVPFLNTYITVLTKAWVEGGSEGGGTAVEFCGKRKTLCPPSPPGGGVGIFWLEYLKIDRDGSG